MGFLVVKYPRWVYLQGLSVQLVAAFKARWIWSSLRGGVSSPSTVGCRILGCPLQGQGEASCPPRGQEEQPHSFLLAVLPAHSSIRSIPWAWLGVGEPRQSRVLRGVSGSAAPTHCEGVGSTWCGGERGDARRCSTPSLLAQGVRRHWGCPCAPASGKKGRKKGQASFLEGLRGPELALVAQTAGKEAPVVLKLVIASDNRVTNLSPYVNQSHSVPHVLLLSRHEGLCVPKTSHPIIPLISLSWRLWLLQRLFKMSLIQSSFVLQRSWLYRAALPKDVRIGDTVQHEAVRAAEEGVEVFGPRRAGGVRWF